MEGKVFPSPRIARVLRDKFVEARLHTDGNTNIERIEEVQTELARTVAQPTFVIQDPTTKRVLGAPVSGIVLKNDFLEYLESALEAKEQVGRLPAR